MFRDLKKNGHRLPPRSTGYKANLKEQFNETQTSIIMNGDVENYGPMPESTGRESRNLSRNSNQHRNSIAGSDGRVSRSNELSKLNEQIQELEQLSSPTSPGQSPRLISFVEFNERMDSKEGVQSSVSSDAFHNFNVVNGDESSEMVNIHSSDDPFGHSPTNRRINATTHLSDKVHDLVVKLDSMKGNLDHSVTDLTLSSAHLHTQIAQNLKHCSEQYLDNLVQEIHYLAKNDIPEIYLKSIPKFAVTSEENVELHRTLIGLKTSAQNVAFPNSLIEKIKYDIRDLFNQNFESLSRELQTTNARLQQYYQNIGASSEQLEEILFEVKTEILLLLERLERSERQVTDLQEELEAQEMHMREKEIMMDILREQVARRDELLDEQRTSFHRELLTLKMALLERNSNRTESFYFGSGTQLELNTQLKHNQKSMEERLEKHVAEMKKSFLREKRDLMYEKKLILEEKGMCSIP